MRAMLPCSLYSLYPKKRILINIDKMGTMRFFPPSTAKNAKTVTWKCPCPSISFLISFYVQMDSGITWQNIPLEALVHIFRFLDPPQIGRCARLSLAQIADLISCVVFVDNGIGALPLLSYGGRPVKMTFSSLPRLTIQRTKKCMLQ